MKTGEVYFAEAEEFGATAAARVSGGFVGKFYVDKSDNQLKVIDPTGAILTAKSNGVPVIFAA